MNGDFDFTTRSLEDEEKKYYGIFISHSSADNDKYLFPLRERMLELDLHPLCDRDFLSGGDDYRVKIEKTLNCYAAVIILTRASLFSDWVNYEMGILAGRDIPIYVYDPEDLLHSKDSENDPELRDIVHSHIGNADYSFSDMEKLLESLCSLSPYAEMFCEENAFLDCASFRARMKERVETVIATLESDIFDEYYTEFKNAKIGMLVPNFGMFYKDHGDGEHCYAKRFAVLDEHCCPHSGAACALCGARELTEENKECVLLNHVLYNGKLMRKGDTDNRGKKVECGSVIFHLPIHLIYGTEFKFIMDFPSNQSYDRAVELLESIGLNPSASSSLFGGRIYLSLPERRSQGLFRLNHEFTNNFLCPHAARKGK